MGKVKKSSLSTRSSSAYILSKSSTNKSQSLVRNHSLQTYSPDDAVSPVKTRSNSKIKALELSKIMPMKIVKIYLVDLIHTNILTRKHRRTLQILKDRKPLRCSISSSFDSHYSDISGSSFRINDRELRSLPVRNERIKRESLFFKCINQPNSSFNDFNLSQEDVSIVKKFYQKDSYDDKNDTDEEKKWRFWNGDLSSKGSSRRSSVVTTTSSDTFSSEDSDVKPKRKSKKASSSSKRKKRVKKLKPLLTVVEKQPSTSVIEAEPLLSTDKVVEVNKKIYEPRITMKRTVVTWLDNKKTTWILNVMPRSEAEKSGKLEMIKKARLARNPLNKLKRSSLSPKKRKPYKKRVKKEKQTVEKKQKVERVLLCCDGPCQCNPEDDLVVHKLPSMPAIDAGEASKLAKRGSSNDDQKKRELSSVPTEADQPSKLRKLNDGKKHPEIIDDTILSPSKAIALISPTAKNLKALGRIPKVDTSAKNDKIKTAVDDCPKSSAVDEPKPKPPRVKIVYDIEDNDKKKQPVPLTVNNVKLFSKMIENEMDNEEVIESEPKVKLRISRFSTRENNNNIEKKSKRNRRDWKKESSQDNDGTNSSSESSPVINKFMRCNSNDSLPHFGQILASASSMSETAIERRVLDWINKDLDISDDKNMNDDLELSDNSSLASDGALKIDQEKIINRRPKVNSGVLEINILNCSDTSMGNGTLGEDKSVDESSNARQSVAEGLVETLKDDDTSSISSSSSSDSSSSSSSASSSSSSNISDESIESLIKDPRKAGVSSVNAKTDDNAHEDILDIVDKGDEDRGYVSIIDDNISINNSNNSNINDKSIYDGKLMKVNDKRNDSTDEKKLVDAEKKNERRVEIDSVLDDNDNVEKNKLIKTDGTQCLEDIEEEKTESDYDAISLYAESLLNEKPDKSSPSPELPTVGDPLKPLSPQNGYNRMESNTFDNYFQLTEQEFDSDYQNLNIQTGSNGLTTRKFRNRLNNNQSSTNNGLVECDSCYARSPNSHTINNENNDLDRFNSGSNYRQLDNNYNIFTNKKLQQQNLIKPRNVFDPEANKSNPTKDYVKQFFLGNCFQHLKTGNCTKVDKCWYNHTINNKLQRIYLDTPEKIYMTLIYAFEQNFYFYLRDVYYKAITRLDIQKIFEFFKIILYSPTAKREMVPDYIRWTIDALIFRNRTLKSIINVLNERLMQMGNMIKPVMAPGEVCNVIINHLATKIDTGCYWETFRCLILNQVSLSPVIVSYILQESIECNKPLPHLRDIDYFLVNYSGEDFFSEIHPELYSKFRSLLDEQTKKEQMLSIDNVVEIRQKPTEAISLASPDTMDTNSLPNNVVNNIFINSMNNNKYIPERDLISLQNNNDHLKIKSAVGPADHQSRIQKEADALPSTSKKDDDKEKLFANKYKLIPIDTPKPKSVYESHVWLLRADLENIKTALQKNDYDEIIKVLNSNKRSHSQPFIRGFYTILCKEVMDSVRHLNEIIQRTVRAGLYVKLNQLLTDTGTMLLITLIDNNYWVLAYHLLQLLNVYLISTDDHTVEFVYVSVEIYVANHKPLKAVELIKRNNMLIGDINNWRVKSNNVKSALKVHRNIMKILFQSLSCFYPQYALKLGLKIVREQKNTFYPINLIHVITDIMNTVSNDNIINTDNNNIENIDYIYTELSKVILSHNVIVYNELLRNIIIEVYHTDKKLSRQLFKYATRMGTYTAVKYEVDSVVTLTIDTNLSEEEMYLLLAESFESLKRQIGCNIYMMQPRKLIFYLNFEIIPCEKMLYKNNVRMKNNVQIIKATKATLARVFDKFNPKLKMLSRTHGQRSCRMVSYTVFPHLITEND